MSALRRRLRCRGWTEHGDTDPGTANLIGIDDNGYWWLPSKTIPCYWDRRFNPRNPIHRVYQLESWLAGRHAFIEPMEPGEGKCP